MVVLNEDVPAAIVQLLGDQPKLAAKQSRRPIR